MSDAGARYAFVDVRVIPPTAAKPDLRERSCAPAGSRRLVRRRRFRGDLRRAGQSAARAARVFIWRYIHQSTYHTAAEAGAGARAERNGPGAGRGPGGRGGGHQPGDPTFAVVGPPDAAGREARERVRSAIRNAGYEMPARGSRSTSPRPIRARRGPRPTCRSRGGAPAPRRARSRWGSGPGCCAGRPRASARACCSGRAGPPRSTPWSSSASRGALTEAPRPPRAPGSRAATGASGS